MQFINTRRKVEKMAVKQKIIASPSSSLSFLLTKNHRLVMVQRLNIGDKGNFWCTFFYQQNLKLASLKDHS